MGLYLTIFDGDEELDGVEIGSYADFAFFREAVVAALEGGRVGSRFPTLILHPDNDGEWNSTDAIKLERELTEIASEFQNYPPVTLPAGWKTEVAKSAKIEAATFYDCFFDIDGVPLLQRLIDLARLSQERDLPILFQ
ncbi:Imm70 family immunity protein [Sphingomonas sp.]|uniref:Imm70 family immunity protein n=1 Tax=Sphingomonas sp. TaxID=28214 RepID=UPI0025F81BB2|nr:Imm70 family immunity protein [Sphingomonas sp.]